MIYVIHQSKENVKLVSVVQLPFFAAISSSYDYLHYLVDKEHNIVSSYCGSPVLCIDLHVTVGITAIIYIYVSQPCLHSVSLTQVHQNGTG